MLVEQYQRLGASAEKEDVHAALPKAQTSLFPGAFCQSLADIAGDETYCSLMHADGAGTKAIIAWLQYQEQGDASVFTSTAWDSAVMNTDDLLCVGATGPFYLANTIGRNKNLVPREVLAAIYKGYEIFADYVKQQGLVLNLCGGETADLGDAIRTLVCDATVFCRMPKRDFINCAQLHTDLSIVAFESTGKCQLWGRENSGIGSNGLTLARHLLLHKQYAELFPQSLDPALDQATAYAGSYSLSDKLPQTELSIGEALLSPCRTYLPLLPELLQRFRPHLAGLIHVTGGALTKCLHFAQGLRYVKNNLFPWPAIFELIAAESKVTAREMYKVFNLGQRLELYVKPVVVNELLAFAQQNGVEARVIGYTEAASGSDNELIIEDRGKQFSYQL